MTSPKTEHSKQIRIQEEKKLKAYILATDLWIEQIEFSKIISSGAEQRVYLSDSKTVIKLNDAINYSSWKDYFQNLLLHNYFFS
ncbi:hypothetical protein [Belliella calami]|uniref:putative polyvalent protein kinase domain-containing protein n=1 Tax=Belliella calami TaxID=2923436 RepID=UPI0034E2ADCA